MARQINGAPVTELRIEPARPADLVEAVAIERQSSRQPWGLDSFQAEAQKPYSRLDVARQAPGEPAVVGYICFWLVADEVHIVNLAVRQGYRCRGIGRRLVLHALDIGARAGARLALLEVRPSNAAARALYESLGFKAVCERPGYYPEFGEPALVLEKQLAGVRRFAPWNQTG